MSADAGADALCGSLALRLGREETGNFSTSARCSPPLPARCAAAARKAMVVDFFTLFPLYGAAASALILAPAILLEKDDKEYQASEGEQEDDPAAIAERFMALAKEQPTIATQPAAEDQPPEPPNPPSRIAVPTAIALPDDERPPSPSPSPPSSAASTPQRTRGMSPVRSFRSLFHSSRKAGKLPQALSHGEPRSAADSMLEC